MFAEFFQFLESIHLFKFEGLFIILFITIITLFIIVTLNEKKPDLPIGILCLFTGIIIFIALAIILPVLGVKNLAHYTAKQFSLVKNIFHWLVLALLIPAFIILYILLLSLIMRLFGDAWLPLYFYYPIYLIYIIPWVGLLSYLYFGPGLPMILMTIIYSPFIIIVRFTLFKLIAKVFNLRNIR